VQADLQYMPKAAEIHFTFDLMATKVPKKKASKQATHKTARGAGDPMRDLHKLLEKQNFQTMEEMEAFMQKVSKGPIPEFTPDNNKDLAEELVREAMGMDPDEEKEAIMEALDLDPDCILAYVALGQAEVHPAIALAFFERGISIGAAQFLTDPYLSETKGHFWGFIETRPFMRCMQGAADSSFYLGRVVEAVATWTKMLELNPNDNQGVRYDLMLSLAGMHAHKEFEELEKQFEDDGAGAAYFNRALYRFTKEGAGPQVQQALVKAMKANPHVVPILLQRAPDLPMVGSYMLGSKEEAYTYLNKAHMVWWGVPGAMDWLKKAVGKRGT